VDRGGVAVALPVVVEPSWSWIHDACPIWCPRGNQEWWLVPLVGSETGNAVPGQRPKSCRPRWDLMAETRKWLSDNYDLACRCKYKHGRPWKCTFICHVSSVKLFPALWYCVVQHAAASILLYFFCYSSVMIQMSVKLITYISHVHAKML